MSIDSRVTEFPGAEVPSVRAARAVPHPPQAEDSDFDLDVTFLEAGGSVADLIHMTNDGCGSTCESACSTTCP